MSKEVQVKGQAAIQKSLAEYREKIRSLKKLEDVVAEEKLITAEIDKHNEYVSKCMITLPAKNRESALQAIRILLDKQKVNWVYALVMAKLYDTFDPSTKAKEVEFTILDTMLRTLSNLEYEGHDEWKLCDTINKFFEPIRDEYVSISEKTYELAEKHVIIDETLRLFADKDNHPATGNAVN